MDSVCLAAKQIWQETGGVNAPRDAGPTDKLTVCSASAYRQNLRYLTFLKFDDFPKSLRLLGVSRTLPDLRLAG